MDGVDHRLALGFDPMAIRESGSPSSWRTMSRIEVFPKELLFYGMSEEVIAWLLSLKIPFIEMKELLCDWCFYVSYPLTKELVDKLGREG